MQPAQESYTRRFEQLLVGQYMDIVAAQDPHAHQILICRKALQHAAPEQDTRATKAARVAAYITLWDALPAADQLVLAGHDAKLGHLARLARTMATTNSRIQTTTAGSIDFVIRKFREQNVA